MNTKIFIVSLPRTGTTSACLYLLDQGYKVAHTAYSGASFEHAQVIADTPVFVDYAALNERYTQTKFVYLERPVAAWLESIRRLLHSMRKQLARGKNIFEPDIVRCFHHVFPDFDAQARYSDEYLQDCYRRHKSDLLQYMKSTNTPCLQLDITDPNAGSVLHQYCSGQATSELMEALPHVNRGRRISYWDSVEHENKVLSNLTLPL